MARSQGHSKARLRVKGMNAEDAHFFLDFHSSLA
jgi:hypothetical protein